MKAMCMAVLAALFIGCTAPAEAAEISVDCSSTNFEFSDPAYNVDCATILFTDGGGGADVMTVTDRDRTIFFTIMERRIVGQPHTFLPYRSLRDNFDATFEDDGIADWKPVDKRAGYEIAEFSREISGQDSRCIAVQRYTHPLHTGYKRRLLGLGCTVGDRQPVYQILQRIAGE